jgi:uncharacterized protein involved in exopolysaccharide biosynthesis
MTAMQAESLEVLEKADVAPAQARAIVRAIEIEIEIAGAKDILATKSDLAMLRQDLRQEMSELRQELRQEMSELRQEMSELRLEFKSDLSRLETKLEGKIHESASGITRQMYTAILGQMAVLLGFAYFFAIHVR